MSFYKKFVPETEKEIKLKYLDKGHVDFRKEYLKPDVFFISDNNTSIFLDYTVGKNKKYKKYKYEILKFFKIIR